MNTPTPSRSGVRLSGFILTLTIALLLLLEPGWVTRRGGQGWLTIAGTIVSISTIYLMLWKTTGIFSGLIALIIVILSNLQSLDNKHATFWNLSQILFLAAVAIHLIAAVEFDHRPAAAFWIICGFGVWTLMAIGWLNAEFALRNEAVAQRPISLALFIMAGFGGVLALFRRGPARGRQFLWCLICIAGIGVGFLGASAFTEVRLDAVLRVGGFDPERIGNGPTDWTWTSPSLIIPLMAIGLLMALVRGCQQTSANEPPVAWLLALAAILLLGGLLPAPADHPGPIGLYWTSIALSVFGVFDGIARVGKRMVLEGPN